jgi:hypothetical protein
MTTFKQWFVGAVGRQLGERTPGQILVMYALGMTFLFGMAALALDVSVALNTKREYQKVAAVCAVVGAQWFPTPAPTPVPSPDTGTVKTKAEACVASNLPSVSPTANIPPLTGAHVGDNTFIELIMDKPANTNFARIFGFDTFGAVGRAVAGGFQPADFAMMSLQGGIESTAVNGSTRVDGNACSRGAFAVSGSNFDVNGQAVANQGFSGSPPNADAGAVVPGPPCLDPDYPFPSPLPIYTPPPALSTGIQCILPPTNPGVNDCNNTAPFSNVVSLCPTVANTPLNVTNSTHPGATVFIGLCDAGTTIRIYDPRSRVIIHPANNATVELMGASTPTLDTGPGIFKDISTCNNATLSNCSGATAGIPLLMLKPGYYDRIDASKFSQNSVMRLKAGLYIINTGLIGGSGSNMDNTTDTGQAAGSQGVSIVVGLTFNPGGSNGSNAAITLNCCAPQMGQNILIYHLGGCAAPYAGALPPATAGQAPIFPIWPDGGGSCPPLTSAATPCNPSGNPANPWCNEMRLQGNQGVKVFNGSIYSPYQCSDAPNPDNTFPKYCSQNHGTTDTRLPQFICGDPSNVNNQTCLSIGGTSTQLNGQVVAPSISSNGGGAIINPPTGFNNLGRQPFLAE